jgi:SAM-dependent methyltransferase
MRRRARRAWCVRARLSGGEWRCRGGGGRRPSAVGDARMPSRDDADDDEEATRAYVKHWDDVYRTDPAQLAREWHVEATAVLSACDGYARAASREGAVVDVGCGSSAVGVDALRRHGFRALVLADVSPTIVAKLGKDFAGDARVRCETCDARAMSGIVGDGEASMVIDKGTIDALNGEDDKRRLLGECARMIAEDGFVVSVSFAAVARFRFLERETEALGLSLRFKVIADGDPARGHRAVFVSVMYKKSSAVMAAVPFERDALTEMLVKRMTASGSLYEDEDQDDVVAPTLDFSKEEEL